MIDLESQWRDFHAGNPHVAVRLGELALRLYSQGVERYGIAGLFEVLRYERALNTVGDDFKLNNSYRAFYARFLMEHHPVLDGFFELRHSVADGALAAVA